MMPASRRVRYEPTASRKSGQGLLQAVLFDMDGLLVNSEPLWFEVEASIMARLGSPWGPADQEHLIGGSLARSSAYMQGKSVRPVARTDIARWLVDGMTGLVRTRGVTMMPGAAALLAELAAAGVPHALVTSAERQIMDAVLQVTGLRFPATVCANDITRSKPDPQPYLLAAERLGVDPGCSVALEDSPSGIRSALAAGCAVIAVPTVPPPPHDGLVTVSSLTEVDLARLRETAGGPVSTP